jgi:hypothetical protein
MAIQDPERASKPIDIELAMVFEHKHVNRAAWIIPMMFQYESSCTSENVEAAIVRAQARSKVLQSAGSGECMATAASVSCHLIGGKADQFVTPESSP